MFKYLQATEACATESQTKKIQIRVKVIESGHMPGQEHIITENYLDFVENFVL